MSENQPWTTAKIADLGRSGDVVQTGPFGAQLHAEDYTKEGIPLILIRNITESGLDESNIPKISTADAERLARYSLIPGDIVFSRVGRVGSCFLAEDKHRGWIISGQTLRTRTDPCKVYPGFLFYALQQESVREYISGASVGTTRTSINTSILENIEIPLPPLPEQKKIAEILSGIDRAIAIHEQQAKVLANMLDALMQEEIVMNTSTKWIKVGDACTAQAGGTPDRSQKGYYEGRIPWVKSGEVRGEDIFRTDEFISNEAISNSSAKIVPSGSVLVAMYGATAGQTARLRIDATTNQAVISLNSKTRELSNDYLYHSVTAFKDQLLLTCQGSGQPNLSAGLIKELEIPLPDPLVQQRITSALDSVRHRVLVLRSKINSSKSLKSSIASDLLSGRRRVSV